MNTYKLSFRLINILGAISWIFISFTMYPSQAWGQLNQPNSNVNNKRLRFIPPTLEDQNNNDGAPKDETTTGGRNPCPNVKIPLTALTPRKKLGLSVSKQPTLWFYVPYYSPNLQGIEFDLLDSENNRVYNSQRFQPQENQNFISIQIPSSISLESNKDYQWALYVYCNPDNSSDHADFMGVFQVTEGNLSLNRELQKAKTLLQQVAAYANNGIWYDAVNTLTRLRCEQPKNAEIESEWISFLESVKGLEEISKVSDIKCYSYKE